MESKSQQFEKLFKEIALEVFDKRFAQRLNQLNIANELAVIGNLAIASTFGWLKDDITLERFLKILISRSCLANNFKTFKPHFGDDHLATLQLQWLSNTNYLVYLFDQLRYFEYIPPHDNPYQLLKEHFTDRDGKEYDSHVLRNSLKNLSVASTTFVDGIIRELKQNN